MPAVLPLIPVLAKALSLPVLDQIKTLSEKVAELQVSFLYVLLFSHKSCNGSSELFQVNMVFRNAYSEALVLVKDPYLV